MQQQGVEKPQRGAGLTEAQKAKLDAAFETCASLLPARLRERIEQKRAFHACLERHRAQNPARGEPLTEEQRAKNRAAFEACRELLPAGPFGPRARR